MAIDAKHIKSLIVKSAREMEKKTESSEHHIFTQESCFHGAFEIESEVKMLHAGECFAEAVLFEKNLRRIRLGLLGMPGAGKSTFVEGLLGSISRSASLFYNPELARVFNSEAAGKVIHYDAGYDEPLHNEPMLENRGMDIVEHAEYARDPAFDYIIHFTYSADGGTRHIAILADQESEERMRLKNFIRALKL